jgi:hypothetical protein
VISQINFHREEQHMSTKSKIQKLNIAHLSPRTKVADLMKSGVMVTARFHPINFSIHKIRQWVS